MVGFGHHVDDGEDVDVAQRGEILAAHQGGAHADEIGAVVRVFGDLEGDGFDGCDDFGGVGEGVCGCDAAGAAVEEGEGAVVG